MNPVVRTFRAADARSALDAVKAALGKDAVILQSKEVGGGLWSQAEIEIVAQGPTPEAPAIDTPAPANDTTSLESEVAGLRKVVEDLRLRMTDRPRPPEVREPGDPAIPLEALDLVRRLGQRGVDASLAEEIVRHALREALDDSPRTLGRAVRDQIARRLMAGPAPWQRGVRRVMALVGPTGVGKTTTIAKIAARAVLDAQLKVALVTTDTYRIGACEHLARYGEIMRLPTHVARDRAGLEAALERTRDADLVLVDTAGRADAKAIAGLGTLLGGGPDLEIALVLCAATGAREIRAAARRYQGLGVSRLIFTKLDEADGPGSIMSAAAQVPRAIACVTNGQRVPDDMHPVTPSSLVELVVGSGEGV